MLGAVEFVLVRSVSNIFVLLAAEDNGKRGLCVARVLFLLRINALDGREAEAFAFFGTWIAHPNWTI